MSEQIMMQTFGSGWRKARSVLDTSDAFTSQIIRSTDPYATSGLNGDAGTATGNSLIALCPPKAMGMPIPNGISVMFYGTGADDATFLARVIGWSRVLTDRSAVVAEDEQVWIPIDLASYTGILSSFVGLAGKTILDTHRLADTLALVPGSATEGVNVNTVSPTGNRPARAYIDLEGSEYVQIQVADGGSATAMGALYKFY